MCSDCVICKKRVDNFAFHFNAIILISCVKMKNLKLKVMS